MNPKPPQGPSLSERELEPQQIGIIDAADRERIEHDERTLFALETDSDERIPILTPASNNSELNSSYFDGEGSYFFDLSQFEGKDLDTSDVESAMAALPSGTKIALEYRGANEELVGTFYDLLSRANRKARLDPECVDDRNDSLASVHHYFSRINRHEEPPHTYSTLAESYKGMLSNGEWDEFHEKGVRFAVGPNIDDDLMDKLWTVYDKTFDELVRNHPSAQKQPREAFVEQTKAEQSVVVYAEDKDGDIASALFLTTADECNWLEQDFFQSKNPDGTTVFVPAISTRLDRRGAAYSPRIISAMSALTYRVPEITAFATQCTNISNDYIPMLAERFTEGTCNLQLEQTGEYYYPVFEIE